jgi:hypothetical protein
MLSNNKNQGGIALLIFIILVALAAITYYFSTISPTELKIDRQQQTRVILKQAKQALIAYAVNYPEISPGRGPGFLPCPDTDDDGNANPPCNLSGVGVVGRLPWAQIDSGDLRDGANERLWYAVTKKFANFPALKLNGESIGQITLRNSDGKVIIDGSKPVYNPVGDPLESVVAVIIAPGSALLRDDGHMQDRTPGGANINDARNYLDIAYTGSANQEDNATFMNASATDGFILGEVKNANGDVIVNDVIEVITYRDIMSEVYKRVGGEIANLINKYYVTCKAYPEASTFDPTKSSFDSAGQTSPGELREGLLPLGVAKPFNWGAPCDQPPQTPAIKYAPVPPAWLAGENWQKTIYYAFAYQNAPPVNSFACGQGTNPPCMTVNNSNPPTNNKQALIVFAGRDITPLSNRPSTSMTDYFEGENNNLDNIYDAAEPEDHVRVITP